MRPLTSATSIWRSTPSVNASSAPVRSCRSTPTSSAKWLRVPAGMHANAIPCAAATSATTASDPSPPATPSASAPPAAAPRASAARSCPGSRMTASTPRSRARSASPARAALPPPDLGLTNNTGRRGGSTGRQLEADSMGVRGRFTGVPLDCRYSHFPWRRRAAGRCIPLAGPSRAHRCFRQPATVVPSDQAGVFSVAVKAEWMVVAGLAQLDALHERPGAVDQVVQAEQQRQGDRAYARAGEQHRAERDRHQPAEDEQRPRPGRLAGGEGGADLHDAGDDRPGAYDQHEHESGGPGPDQGDHSGGEVHQPEEQVPEHGPRAGAAERPHGLQAGRDERVHGEQDDQGEHRDLGPGQRHDADCDGEDAAQDQGGAQ